MADGTSRSGPGGPAQRALEQLREVLAADSRRVTDRLRGLSHARLAAEVPPYATRADAARHVAGVLAATAQGLAARADPAEPVWRALPRLSDFAAGDQVAVTAHDLLAELDALVEAGDDDADVWTPAGRRTAVGAVTDAVAELTALRRLL